MIQLSEFAVSPSLVRVYIAFRDEVYNSKIELFVNKLINH